MDRASPHNPVFRRIPATSNELVNLVRTTLGPHQGTIAAAEDGVRIGAIPIAVLAERSERPVGLAYAQRAGGIIPAATHEPHLLASEFAAARTALDGRAILDTGTVIVANLIPVASPNSARSSPTSSSRPLATTTWWGGTGPTSSYRTSSPSVRSRRAAAARVGGCRKAPGRRGATCCAERSACEPADRIRGAAHLRPAPHPRVVFLYVGRDGVCPSGYRAGSATRQRTEASCPCGTRSSSRSGTCRRS